MTLHSHFYEFLCKLFPSKYLLLCTLPVHSFAYELDKQQGPTVFRLWVFPFENYLPLLFICTFIYCGILFVRFIFGGFYSNFFCSSTKKNFFFELAIKQLFKQQWFDFCYKGTKGRVCWWCGCIFGKCDQQSKQTMDVLMRRGYESFVKLDSGGQANVYKSVKNNKLFAIKVVHVENPNNPKLDDDLKRELQIVRNLKHPNCIHVEELFRTKNKIYIIMDFMSNGTIGTVVRKNGALCEWNAKVWFCPIAKAIKYLHDHKIAHRFVCLCVQ